MSGNTFGARPGPTNSMADLAGLHLGHATGSSTGCTVIVAPAGATAAVDVRGGGPGTRETDLLEPHNTVAAAHAVALCGGSAFGLAAADGVMVELERRGIGFPAAGAALPRLVVPIVPAAVIFDLLLGDAGERPGAADGAAATAAALDGPQGAVAPPHSGSIGAGRGALAGSLKGGFGQASAVVEVPGVGERTIAVAVVVNPFGSVFNPVDGLPWGLGAGLGGEFDAVVRPAASDLDRVLARGLGGTKAPPAALNTTIGVVATDAPVTKAQARRLAIAGHDGLARAVRPAHAPFDGDTFFALATGEPAGVGPDELTVVASVAADTVERAIVHAVLAATPVAGASGWSQLLGQG